MLKQVKEKTLGQVSRIVGIMSLMPHKSINWVPVDLAEFFKRLARTGSRALSRKQNCGPASGAKSAGVASGGVMVGLQLWTPCSALVYQIQSAMKIPDFDAAESHDLGTESLSRGFGATYEN